jgi:hypothetical protein
VIADPVRWVDVRKIILKLVSLRELGLAIASTGAEYDENATSLRLNLKKAIAQSSRMPSQVLSKPSSAILKALQWKHSYL